MIFHISTIFTIDTYIWTRNMARFPAGLIAQLVEHCNGIAEVTGLNPAEAQV